MCNVCFKEFKGWCKSFTRTETLLSILEAFLLILAVGYLVFLILHFLACTSDDNFKETLNNTETSRITLKPDINEQTTFKPSLSTKTPFTLVPPSKCTWKPSEKTKAPIKYYEYNTTESNAFASTTTTVEDLTDRAKANKIIYKLKPRINHTGSDYGPDVIKLGGSTETVVYPQIYDDEEYFTPDDSDGEEADEMYQQYVLALVKLHPPADITFGCILTIVSEYWSVTSASCIEAIEEVDSLDSFVMMEDYGEVRKGKTHVISDVEIHPMFEGVNKSYDLAALKSEDSLMKGSGYSVDLPSLIDYFMITIGERLILLGYGPYRTIDTSPHGKRLHRVNVYTLPSQQCPQQDETWSLRHLWGGEAVGVGRNEGRCGATGMCGGALHARGLACNYCAGSPLLHGSVLIAVMSENQQCGVSCEPQMYVNIAMLREWLDLVTSTK